MTPDQISKLLCNAVNTVIVNVQLFHELYLILFQENCIVF